MKRILLSAAAISMCITAMHALPDTYFTRSSRLSSGKWVKVGVDKSGIYEISYARLKEMGFSDPSKVGVLGRGGRQMEEEFTGTDGQPLNIDDLSPISVLHKDDKIYFYGEGTDIYEITRNSRLATGGSYVRKSKNIYSDLGYYFLTDTEGNMIPMEEDDTRPSDTQEEVTSGLDHLFHDNDITQNTSRTGQLFWGERFNNGHPSRQSWKFTLPGLIPDAAAIMDCYFYVERRTTGQLSWGVENGSANVSFPTVEYNSSKTRPQEPFQQTVNIPSRSGEVFVEYHSDNNQKGVANLDYWNITYTRRIPTLRDIEGNPMAQERIAFPQILRGKTMKFNIGNNPETSIFDITDPRAAKLIVAQSTPEGMMGAVKGTDDVTELIFADLSRPQLQITGYENGYERILNQNIHEAASKGASLLIITTEELQEEAEKLADLHRQHDGIGVLVCNTTQIYNEFSSGVPDIMAYRSLARMLYESKREPLKNILLLGPLYGDFRGMTVKRDPRKGIIAYQNKELNVTKGSQNVNDFLGMMDDNLQGKTLEKCDIHIGVGILPCNSPGEVANATAKIKRYLETEDFAYTVNKMMTLSCPGDLHTHDKQVISLGKYLTTNNSGYPLISTLCVDAYGYDNARRKFLKEIAHGTNIITYFGHGAPHQIVSADFFSMSDVKDVRTEILPFMIFAGCTISNSDRGERGIGEALVLDNKDGLIGAMLATRDTWSGENMDFVKLVLNCLTKNGFSVASGRIEEPRTFGEAFALAKQSSSYSNELAYQLVCDPALRLPVVTHYIKYGNSNIVARPGQQVKICGTIHDSNGKSVNHFNGDVVIRLMRPEYYEESLDVITGDRYEPEGEVMNICYPDAQLAAVAGKVIDGRFELTLTVPREMGKYEGEKALAFISAYDKSLHIAAATRMELPVEKPIGNEPVRKDEVPPVIDRFEYDQNLNSLDISVSDNVAVDASGRRDIKITLDGKALVANGTFSRYSENGKTIAAAIRLPKLADGPHSARATVCDAEGNSTTSEIAFHSGQSSRITLVPVRKVARESAEFEIEGEISGDLTLFIRTPSGKEVARIKVSGRHAVWNLEDSDGNAVGNGHYKAFVRESANTPDASHSESIDITVLRPAASGDEG